MKKLMIAAAAAAMVGGAYAATCSDDDDCFCGLPGELAPGCAVYDVKMKLKTLAPKKVVVKECGSCSDTVCTCMAYYKNATRTFDGVLWACDYECEDVEGEAMNIVMWEKKSKMPVLGLLNGGVSTVQLPFDLLCRYDKKANKVQAVTTFEFEGSKILNRDGDTFDFDGVVTAAGFGSFDTKNLYIKSLKGNCAGFIKAFTIDSDEKSCLDECENYVVDLCTEFEDYEWDGVELEYAAASGTWSLKYNKSLSSGKKIAAQVIPAYAHE